VIGVFILGSLHTYDSALYSGRGSCVNDSSNKSDLIGALRSAEGKILRSRISSFSYLRLDTSSKTWKRRILLAVGSGA